MKEQSVDYAPEGRYFREAVERHSLVLPVCSDCERPHFYPRAVCPFCRGQRIEWKAASGRGRIYSYTVMHYVNPPEVVACITLEEGVTLLSSIVDADVEALRIGAEVRVDFISRQETTLPVFVLSERNNDR